MYKVNCISYEFLFIYLFLQTISNILNYIFYQTQFDSNEALLAAKKKQKKKPFLHSRLHLVILHSAFCEKLLLFILHNDFQNVWNFTGIQFVDCTLSSTFLWLPVYSVPPSLWLSAGSALTRPPLPVPGIFWILGGFFSHHYEQIL